MAPRECLYYIAFTKRCIDEKRRREMRRRIIRQWLPLIVTLLLAALASPAHAASGTYQNPLDIQIPGDGKVESCADPSIIRAQDGYWYMYCTTDPLRGDNRDAQGNLIFHLIPIHRSFDLVHWTHVGDVFSAR